MMSLALRYSDFMETILRQHKSHNIEEARNWEQLPSELVVKIVQKLDLADSIRLSVVCKHWRLIVKENKQRNAQVPWLMLPHDRHDTSNCSNFLRFVDMSDGVFYNIKLPPNIVPGGGWCCCGSSKGWLAIISMVEKGHPKSKSKSKFDPKLFLFNSISGIQVPLPSIATIPSFATFLDNLEFGYDHNNVTELANFIKRVELLPSSSSAVDVDARNCIVAAATTTALYIDDELELALCKPGDTKWTIFDKETEEEDDDKFISDILFYNGELHVLVLCKHEVISFEIHTKYIMVGDHDHQVILRFIPNNWMSLLPTIDTIWDPEDESEHLAWILPYLVESSQGELLIVHKIMDTVFSDGEDEEAAEGEGVMIYKKLIRFEVFKIDPISSDTMRFTKLNSLDNQTLCVSKPSTSLSVPVAAGDDDIGILKKNCIYFVDDSNYVPNPSRGSGMFQLEDGRIQRFIPTRIPIQYYPTNCMTWFSPNLKIASMGD